MKSVLRLSWLLVLVASAGAFGSEVTQLQAQTAARNWVRRSPVQMTAEFKSSEVSNAQTAKDDDGKALYHVVELDGGGFVVTSGDTELPPVIAFSASGALDLSDTGNPLVAMLESDLASRKALIAASKPAMAVLAAAQAGDDDSSSSDMSPEDEWASLLEEPKPASGLGVLSATGTSSISDVRVTPMVMSKWNQSTWNGYNTFNYYTPNNYVCGCVATAFAQIMRYWQKPTASVSAGTYTCWVNGYAVSKTMIGGTYNWGSMPLTENGCTTATQRQAIGKLLYDVGVASQMQWTYDTSGTWGCITAQALRQRFGYASAHSYSASTYSDTLTLNLAYKDNFRNAILASLDAGMPVAIGILSRGVGGHEVVVDGYGYNGGSTIYCHINCGWSGADDAWYNFIGEGITRNGYSILSEVIYNIHPSVSGDVISGRVLNPTGSPVSGATVLLTSSSGAQQTATTNSKGIYWFRAVANTTYTLVASQGNLSSALRTETLPSSFDVEAEALLNSDGTPYLYKPSTSSLYPCGKLGNKWGVDLTLRNSASVSLATALDNTTLTFTTGGSASWFGQTAQTHDGVDAAQSGAIGHSQQSWLETSVAGPGVLSFYWKVSCEGNASHQNWDYLSVSIDNEEKARICGTDNSWAKLTYSIPSGTHVVRWLYSKNGSTSSGDDAGYVDQVEWTPTPSSGDAYDPGDDTSGGATTIAPSDAIVTHGGHTLSSTDKYDFFKAYLSTGYKYVFETTGSMDTYGDLFDSSTLANNVACNDDGGENRNFKIEFVPEKSGTYYLRVRAYSIGSSGSYSLSYQRFAGDGGGSSTKPDLIPFTPSGWSSPLVVADSNVSREGGTSFPKGASLYASWAVICRNAAVGATFYSRLYIDGSLVHSWYMDGLQQNYYAWVGGYLIGSLSPGTHTVRIVHDATGAVAESNESNNAFETSITVVDDYLPNLKIASQSVSKTSVTLSEPLVLHWRVANGGNAQAAKSKSRVRIYKYVSGQRKLVRTIVQDCAPLAAGAARNYKQSVSFKSYGTGTYSIEIAADYKSSVSESNETDNSSSLSVYVTKNIATKSSSLVDWQFHKMNAREPAPFYLSTSLSSKKKVSTFKRGQKIYVQLNFWNAKKNVRTIGGVYAKAQLNGGRSETWYWSSMGAGSTGYISNGSRSPGFLQNLPAGDYTLTATLDCYDNWWETSENNNIRRISFKVVEAPAIHGGSTFKCALNEPVSWAISSEGTMSVRGLPPGLKYSGGAIVGKATKTGTYTAKFTAKNAAGTRTKTVKIVVSNPGFVVNVNVRANGATDAISVNSGGTVPMYVGVVQSISVASTPGKSGVARSAASSVSATGLPPGLKYSKGVISGVPTKTGTYTVKLVFRNALGWSKSFTMKMAVKSLPAFARGTFNGWSYVLDDSTGEPSDIVRKAIVGVTSAGKISASVGSLAFARTGWTVDGDGNYVAKMRTVRTSGTGKNAKTHTDVLALTLAPGAAWTEDQLTGMMGTFNGDVTQAKALASLAGSDLTLAPSNADTYVSARRNPFGDNAEAKALASELASAGTWKWTDGEGFVWNVKADPNGVVTISRTTGTGKGKKTISATAPVTWDGGDSMPYAIFKVDGRIVTVPL